MACEDFHDWRAIVLSQLSYSSSCETLGGCSSCRALATLETQINDTISALNLLLLKHRSKKTDLNRAHSQMMQKLPVEIMSLIFHLCSPATFQNDLENARQQDVFAPLTLGAVCRSWRHLAWSTPQLWTHLVFLRPFFKQPDRVSLAWEWISRSKALPLTIYVNLYDNERHMDGGPPLTHRPFLDILAECSRRWRDIDLNIPTHFLGYLFTKVQDMPKIDTLRLRPGITSRKAFKLFSGRAPSPRHVIASGLLLKQMNIDWSRVAEVKVDDFFVEDCMELFRCAPMLQKCDLVQVGYSMTPPSISPLSHDALRHLSFDSIDSGEDFFSAITLPNLISFSFDKHGHRCYNAALLPFFQRSSFPLTRLELLNIEFSFDDFKSLLGTVPTVTHLHLTMSPDLYDQDEKKRIREPLIHELTENTNLLPHLEMLEFSLHAYDHTDFRWKSIPAIVASLYRSDSSSRGTLKTFKFNLSHNHRRIDLIPRGIRVRLLTLRQAGAQIFCNDELIEKSKVFRDSIRGVP